MNGLKQDRYATFLAYLNTVMEGGETEFPGKVFFARVSRTIFICFQRIGNQNHTERGSSGGLE